VLEAGSVDVRGMASGMGIGECSTNYEDEDKFSSMVMLIWGLTRRHS
jgi:hypothetical protein